MQIFTLPSAVIFSRLFRWPVHTACVYILPVSNVIGISNLNYPWGRPMGTAHGDGPWGRPMGTAFKGGDGAELDDKAKRVGEVFRIVGLWEPLIQYSQQII